jgi:hypothetical protein
MTPVLLLAFLRRADPISGAVVNRLREICIAENNRKIA